MSGSSSAEAECMGMHGLKYFEKANNGGPAPPLRDKSMEAFM